MSKYSKPQIVRPIGKPLTEEEKKEQVTAYLAQKRNEFALSILNGLCHNPAAISIRTDRDNGIDGELRTRLTNGDQLVDAAIGMADRLIERLYIPQGGDSEKPNNHEEEKAE